MIIYTHSNWYISISSGVWRVGPHWTWVDQCINWWWCWYYPSSADGWPHSSEQKGTIWALANVLISAHTHTHTHHSSVILFTCMHIYVICCVISVFSAVGFLHGKLYILKDSDDVFNFDFSYSLTWYVIQGVSFCMCLYICVYVGICVCACVHGYMFVCVISHFIHAILLSHSLHPSHMLTTLWAE